MDTPQNKNKEAITIDDLYISKLLHEPKLAKRFSYWLAAIFIIFFVTLFLPWQQNIRGYGTVTAFSPKDRPQQVVANVPGQIVEWYVQEGQRVSKGDTLATIAEVKTDYFDPELLKRKRDLVLSQEKGIKNMFDKVQSLDKQIAAMQQGLEASINKTRNKIKQAKFKISIDSANLVAVETQLNTAKEQYNREQLLYDEGLKSLSDLENKNLKYRESVAKLQEAQNKLRNTQNMYLNSIIELSSVEAEYNDKISKAMSEKSSTLAYINDAENKLTKQQIDVTNLELRQSYYAIRAPQDGFIVKAIKSGIGEIIKESEPLLTIMPSDPKLAVELYISAADIPLITIGRKVRVRFDGWPALVFSGWPNASLGTFGGEVAVVDYVNSYNNKYRVLVKPDPNDDPWPDPLRIGSGIFGWAMLDDVPIWYEIWRQLNAFPPRFDLENKPANSQETKKESK